MASPPPLMSSAPPPIHHLLCHNSLRTLIIILHVVHCLCTSSVSCAATSAVPPYVPTKRYSISHHPPPSFLHLRQFIHLHRSGTFTYYILLIWFLCTPLMMHFTRHSLVIPSSFLRHYSVSVLHAPLVPMLHSTTPPQRYSSLAFTSS